MNDSPSPAQASLDDAAATAAASKQAKARRGPRRAGAPAGSPKVLATPAVIVVSDDGVVQPAAVAMPAAGKHDDDAAAGDVPTPDSPATAPTGDEPVQDTVLEADSKPDTAAPGDAAEEPATAGSETAAEDVDETLAESPEARAKAPETASTDEPVADEDTAATVTEPQEPADAVALPLESAAAPAPDEPVVPTSRRALREANSGKIRQVPPVHKAAPRSEPEPASPAAPLPASGDSPTTRSRPWAFLRAFLFMLVIAALVIAVGTVVSGQEDTGDGPSATEQARQSTLAGTTLLLAEATALRHGTGGAAGATADAQGPLDDAITALAAQQLALGDGSAPSTLAPTVKPGLTMARFVTDLAANANTALTDSLPATSAMGRLFASVGTNQLLTARELAAATSQPVPRSAFLPAGTAGAIAQTPLPLPESACTSTLAPKQGVTEDQALLTAAAAEQKAVYAYQVSATRFSEPRFSQATTILAAHQASLARLNAELAAKCLPTVDVVPGFQLDAGFTATPATALAQLEAQLGLVYGDLAALTGPEQPAPASNASPAATVKATPEASGAPSMTDPDVSLREVSVDALVQTALNRLAWDGMVAPLPGIPAADGATPKPAKTPAK